MVDILALHSSSAHPTLLTAVFTIMLAFLLSTLIAVTYEKTFRGLSYSRSFVQALILSSLVSATIMHAIGDSLAIGLGLLGALAIIRFRINIRDPRDIIFMFAALAAGIASGVYAYDIAVVGTLFFCLVAVVLYFSPFGQSTHFDGMLRFNIENQPESKRMLEKISLEYCKVFALVTLRDMAQGKRLDYAYHIKLKKGKSKSDFIEELNTVKSIKGVSLLLQESTVEI